MPPTLPPPKERLKDFFLQLQADCKSMVAEPEDEDEEGIEHPLDEIPSFSCSNKIADISEIFVHKPF
ncbi:hypothetical protein PILCRDRAFT_4944 [Piloderma croceum F 1598]|uniref:Uncharacterized protein n=1 Tax=Piloderma croceum (strain F 1598) TaxID=765440 RepID=A0A0C3BJD7_PILCF|nr:hypothetical protein PILCRDRAFT_4944 [Piloderma croceum F 1598]